MIRRSVSMVIAARRGGGGGDRAGADEVAVHLEGGQVVARGLS